MFLHRKYIPYTAEHMKLLVVLFTMVLPVLKLIYREGVAQQPFAVEVFQVFFRYMFKIVCEGITHLPTLLYLVSKFLYSLQLAETLLKKETLNYADVESLIGPPPHGRKNLMDPADYEVSVQHAAGSNDTSSTSDRVS